MESWKTYQKKYKFIGWIAKLKYLSLIIIFLLLASLGLLLFNWLNSSPGQVEEHNGFGQVEWGSGQLNLFINPDYLVGFDPGESELKYFRFEEPVENIASLAIVSKQKKVVLDGYLNLDQGVTDITRLGNEIFRAFWRKQLKTNLTKLQIFRLWLGLRRDYTLLAQESESLPEADILAEKLKVTILNGTNVPGLAAETIGWVSNLGAEVLELGNTSYPVDRTQIEVYVPDESSRLVERLEEIFNVSSTRQESSNGQTQDILITLGREYLR